MGRLGIPEKVADVIAFIASGRAHWINGTHIRVDGLQQSSIWWNPAPYARVLSIGRPMSRWGVF